METLVFLAPEILEEAQAFPQSDMWSLGVLLYVLLSGQLPFKGDSAEETKANILDVKFKFEWLYNEVTMEATRLLMWIFKRTPWKRPLLEEVQNHRWLNSSDYMFKKRERAHFTTNRIQVMKKRDVVPMCVFTFRLSLTEIRGRVSPQPTTYGSGQCQFHFQINVKC